MDSKIVTTISTDSQGPPDRIGERDPLLDAAESLSLEGDDDIVSHRVPAEAQGARLDKWLADWPEFSSRAEAQRLLQQERIFRGDQAMTTPSQKLKEGEVYTAHIPPPEPMAFVAEEGPLDILFEDEHIIVLNKPAGLVVHPAPGHTRGTLVNRLLHHCDDLSGIGGVQRPGIVHRLDKDTSGVLVVAKHDRAHQRLSRQFRKHTIHREYSALVWNNPVKLQGFVNAPIGRHPRERRQMAVVEEGREAHTHWMVRKRWQGVSHLHCRLETGRTHQIRVHMTSIGHPLIGDPLYGNIGKTKHLSEPLKSALLQFHRQALHAVELGFEHPITEVEFFFETPEPEDFQRLLALLDEHLPSN
jgi:23S rRNA pseudouridine1911/1915/1917 synthase